MDKEYEVQLGASTTPESAVRLTSVSKDIGKRSILIDVNLAVPVGSICGIRGRNGSGKSVCLRVIAGLIRPTRGTISVFGQLLGGKVEFPDATGAMIDGPGVLHEFSAMLNLEMLASIRKLVGQHEIREVIEAVGLDPDDKRPVRTYSTGMRQRLGIAQAIMEAPRLLLLIPFYCCKIWSKLRSNKILLMSYWLIRSLPLIMRMGRQM